MLNTHSSVTLSCNLVPTDTIKICLIRWSRWWHGDIGEPHSTWSHGQGRNYPSGHGPGVEVTSSEPGHSGQSVSASGTMRSSGWSLVMMMLSSGWPHINGARDGQTLIRRRLLLRPDPGERGEEHNTLSRLRRFHNNTSGLGSGPSSHLMPASNRPRSLVKKKIKKIIKSKSRKSGGRPNLLSNNNTATANIGPSNSPSNTLENFNR